jgi:Rrf2 family protein
LSENSRYTVAIHILTLLAHVGDERLTSEYIAGSVNTNPVVIRRILASLRRANLVVSQGGSGGGWKMTKPARGITLRDVYRAVDDGDLFPMHTKAPNPKCPVGRNIQEALSEHYQEAQLALEKELERTTIAALVDDVESRK